MENNYMPLDEQIENAEKIRDAQTIEETRTDAKPGVKEIILEH